MMLSRTLSCYLVLAATGVILAVGRVVRRPAAAQAKVEGAPQKKVKPAPMERAG